LGHRRAGKVVTSRGRRVQQAKYGHQRRLAAARRAHDGDVFSRHHSQSDAGESMSLHLVGKVYLGQIADVDDRTGRHVSVSFEAHLRATRDSPAKPLVSDTITRLPGSSPLTTWIY